MQPRELRDADGGPFPKVSRNPYNFQRKFRYKFSEKIPAFQVINIREHEFHQQPHNVEQPFIFEKNSATISTYRLAFDDSIDVEDTGFQGVVGHDIDSIVNKRFLVENLTLISNFVGPGDGFSVVVNIFRNL